jgi:hypothetical protein
LKSELVLVRPGVANRSRAELQISSLDYALLPCTMRDMVSAKRESLITQMRRGALLHLP